MKTISFHPILFSIHMRTYKTIVILTLLCFCVINTEAKKLNLQYNLKVGDTITYNTEIFRSKNLLVDGIKDLSSFKLNYSAKFIICEKNKDNVNIKLIIGSLIIKTYWGEIETGTVTISDENFQNPILFSLSKKGDISEISGIDKDLKTIKADNIIKTELLNTFSEHFVYETLRHFFPKYPEQKIPLNYGWDLQTSNFGYLNLEVDTKYFIESINNKIQLTSTDSIPKQTINMPFSGFKATYIVKGFGTTISIIDAKAGLTTNTKSNQKIETLDTFSKIVYRFESSLIEQ